MVYTAEGAETSTEANVEILLMGEQGASGWRPLTESKVRNIKWLSGQVDMFSIEAAHLGDLHTVKLKHDGTDPGKGRKECARFKN
jgi:hypothetical protein